MTRPKGEERERGTTIGIAIWDWPPWIAMSMCARSLWLGLYTTAEARRCPPGLWQGGPAVMAEAARMRQVDVDAALVELATARLVEFDPHTRVLRFTELPDRCEKAYNADVLRSWWTRFKTLPACTVRDSHLEVLAWLNGTTQRHQDAWAQTFGTVRKPLRVPLRPHGVGHGVPHGGGHHVPSSDSAGSDTMSDTVSDTNGERVRDLSSSDPDPDQNDPPPRSRDLVSARGQLALDQHGRECAVIGNALVSREFAEQPGMADMLGRALARYGPLAAVVEAETNSARRFR